jgi:hypothetical protein|tara:strand:+ start:62 stop:418 length:357 start_codon:yes stop_codon:yes gene_type:complete
MIKAKYGYKMFDCSIKEWHDYDMDCYAHRVSHTPRSKFDYLRFDTIESAISLIRHVFVPLEHETKAVTHWALEEGNTLLVKQLNFTDATNSREYQSAIERAWALGGHLDPRVEQVYYD